jgi:serine/threonine-protein kinase SRPK3
VSIKITKANRKIDSRALRNLQALARHSDLNPDSSYVVHLFDDFVHEGPNGSHQCLVFEFLGPTVDTEARDTQYFGERLDTDTITRVSSQMLEGVALMHESGYTHGGTAIYGSSHPQPFHMARSNAGRSQHEKPCLL